jgi:hypothetical protein
MTKPGMLIGFFSSTEAFSDATFSVSGATSGADSERGASAGIAAVGDAVGRNGTGGRIGMVGGSALGGSAAGIAAVAAGVSTAG